MVSFDAILFPADERAPHLVPLMTSGAPSFHPLGQPGSHQPLSAMTQVPHPEMYMDFIAEGVGTRAWKHHVSCPSKFFACFYPPPGVSCVTFFFHSTQLFHFPLTLALLVPEAIWAMIISLPRLCRFLPDSPNANQTNPTGGRPSLSG